jgi:hypothetical protein
MDRRRDDRELQVPHVCEPPERKSVRQGEQCAAHRIDAPQLADFEAEAEEECSYDLLGKMSHVGPVENPRVTVRPIASKKVAYSICEIADIRDGADDCAVPPQGPWQFPDNGFYTMQVLQEVVVAELRDTLSARTHKPERLPSGSLVLASRLFLLAGIGYVDSAQFLSVLLELFSL